MSLERELLNEWVSEYATNGDFVKVYRETMTLFSQSEQEGLTPRQGLEEYKRGYAQAELDLKPEPLSDEQIMLLGKQNLCLEANAFKPVGFARAIEKAHGIGVDYE
jgi:hypothetical protein